MRHCCGHPRDCNLAKCLQLDDDLTFEKVAVQQREATSLSEQGQQLDLQGDGGKQAQSIIKQVKVILSNKKAMIEKT